MHLRALKRLGHVTMIVPPLDEFRDRYDPADIVLEREPTMAEDRFWRHESSKSVIKRWVHALRKLNFVDARARSVDRERFSDLVAQKYDLLFAFRLRSVVWWESIFRNSCDQTMTRVIDFDDIESVVFSKRIERETRPFWRWKFSRELAWLRSTERRVASQWNAFCQCSEIDATRMNSLTSRTAWVIPNAYDFQPFPEEQNSECCVLLFVGTLSYFPNVEGIEWFFREVWPIVRQKLDERVRLEIVGLRPPAQIQALDLEPAVSVTANAPSVAPHYAEAHIIIAPLMAGSGTRIKLIEASAMGRAIVTTSLGCEGLGFVDGVHAEIADNPEEFAERVIALARNPARRAGLAEAAREHAIAAFSSDAVVESLEQNLRDLLAKSTRDFSQTIAESRRV